MKRKRVFATILAVATGMVGCGDGPAAPAAERAVQLDLPVLQQQQGRPEGSGLVLESITGVAVPVLGTLGDVVIDQAVITNFALVENTVGQIVGLEAEGILQLSGGVLGTDVVTEDFTTTVAVTSSGPGRCEIVTIDLGPLDVDLVDGIASIDVPEAEVSARGSGAVGTLLCTLGSLLGALTGGGGIVPGVGGIVNAINGII